MSAVAELENTYHVPPGASDGLLADLELRLERGLAIIEQRESAGQSVVKLEEHWISLLHEYERVFNSLN